MADWQQEKSDLKEKVVIICHLLCAIPLYYQSNK